MAALATQVLGAGGVVTTAAAAGGGDTIESSSQSGGWLQPVILRCVVGATATTVTVDGTAFGPYTSQTADILINNGVRGARKNITYSQVTAVTVGAYSLGTSNAYASYGT
jgi:hypothetical protein